MAVRQEQIEKAVEVAKRFGATRLLLFGSAVESPATARDLDLACEGVEGWEFFGLQAALEDAIGVPVDLVSLTPESSFVHRIEREGRVLYEDRTVATAG